MTNRGPNDRKRHRKPQAPKPESLPVQPGPAKFEIDTLFQDDVTPLTPPPIPSEFVPVSVLPPSPPVVQGARSKKE